MDKSKTVSLLRISLQNYLHALQKTSAIWVAYSGGLDSTALLHACAQLPEIKPRINAVYIHHQLSPHATCWQQHCQKTAGDWGVPFTALTVDGKAQPGESPEAAARTARYAALQQCIRPGDSVLTAHHADDQIETVLLQLFRGAGLKGLGGMQTQSAFGVGFLLRPFLGIKRSTLEAYTKEHHLQWVEDESNQDLNLNRNFLRRQVLPVLKSRWPDISTTVSRSSRHCQEADLLITEEARARLKIIVQPPLPHKGWGEQNPTLSIAKLSTFSKPWQRYILRQWIMEAGSLPPSTQKIEQIIQTIVDAAWDSAPCVRWKRIEIRRYRDKIYKMPPLTQFDSKQVFFWKPDEQLALPQLEMIISKEAFEASDVDFASLTGPFTIRFRQGGEKCLLPGHAHHTPLKNVFQTRGIPPWLRDRIPLLCVGELVVGMLTPPTACALPGTTLPA